MNCVFGPVPSRRLGRSLGIDPIPLKTCNWNCVYCQLGRSVPMINERREYIPRNVIVAQLDRALAAHAANDIDWITFVGSGEPTLHSGLGWLIRAAKSRTNRRVAVITNGALLYQPEVRRELSAADAVLPTLDAGTPELYHKINRPWPELLFERFVEGLTAFRRDYAGQLWIEVMLVKGLNDSGDALQTIAAVLQSIRPDQVHINLPIRPPAEPWVQPADETGVARALQVFGQVAQVVRPASGAIDLSGSENLRAAILSIITRHPLREADLQQTLGNWTASQIETALAELVAAGQAQIVTRYGTRFWSAAAGRYASKVASRGH
jgi:wyosine [tRNA(Phe)-imidazoG37] synthetase (radical SAM superfamily)